MKSIILILIIVVLCITTSFSQKYSRFINSNVDNKHYEWVITFNNNLDLIKPHSLPINFLNLSVIDNNRIISTGNKTYTIIDQLIGNKYYTLTKNSNLLCNDLVNKKIDTLYVLPSLAVKMFIFNEKNPKLGIVINEENDVWVTNDNGKIYKSVFDAEQFSILLSEHKKYSSIKKIEHLFTIKRLNTNLNLFTAMIHNDTTYSVSFTYETSEPIQMDNNGYTYYTMKHKRISGFLYTNNGGQSWKISETPELSGKFCVSNFIEIDNIMYYEINGCVFSSKDMMKTVKLERIIKINDNNFEKVYNGVLMNNIDAKPFILYKFEQYK
jgi:hypothetical protein